MTTKRPRSKVVKTLAPLSEAPPKPTKPGHRTTAARPSALLDTRIIYCGDCLERLSEPRPSGSGLSASTPYRHAGTQAYIEYMRPHCVDLARVLKIRGSFYYHCDWHASHYVKVFRGDEEHAETHQKRYHPIAKIVFYRHLPKT